MNIKTILRTGAALGLVLALAGCGASSSKLFSWGGFSRANEAQAQQKVKKDPNAKEGTIWDLFSNSDDPNITIEVNRYLWQASLEVLNFLPVQSVDPFSGVIVTGYGTPPGGGRAYKATVYINDPALDARSLKVALETRSGPVSAATQHAVEDAILTRARQLRVAASKL
ncbi:DUF3576 domain-containing protein [Thioclava sp. A2]|uniref:DUF3576 domain-containing protein n=1 Tax=Thioclava sp. FCG-A2 TaxID=3080562 RepID=UPI002955DE9D|nr:DUF3576 domain-containing protein [Thioclava sp. A2]MDV7272023.1 DUF3576 domain-containing protein [Thioclava sp. A2]